jgi:Tfp pilus assembly protein PilV
MTGQINSSSVRSNHGFSMIDVLVAIVVLATALLALAALQGALTRNAADARSRSQIVAYTEGLIDQSRATSYDSIAAGTIVPSNGSTASAQEREAYYAQTASGASDLKTVITSTEYYGTTAGTGGTFSATAPSDLSSYTPRYKQVNVTTTWSDATGQPRTMSIDTIVSPLTISTDDSLASQSLSISGSATPTVREYNPGATAGVIPIAVGSGSQTAATNPAPEILALNGNKTAVVGTSYNVLTYQAPDDNNETIIQKRVDTLVVQCTCAFSGTSGAAVTSDDNTDIAGILSTPYYPTYWDGTQYVVPTATGAASSSTQVYTSVTQSPYCDVCCRDHNDVDDSTAEPVKFDPWTTDYRHFNYVGNTLTAATSGTFLNACRLVRVDGQYRVATDLKNYFFGLLATEDMPNAPGTTSIPDSSSTDCTDPKQSGVDYVSCYKDFIKEYLAESIDGLKAGTGAIDSTTANALYTTYDLDNPASISIDATDTAYRYLHARGLYIDHLESDVLTKIKNAIDTCTYTDIADCYLPLLPFTTINVTELATWQSSDGDTLQVFDNEQNSISGDPTAPIRGYATAGSKATSGETADSTASIKLSNSGVAVGAAVDEDDETTVSDVQAFDISGTNQGSTFTITLGGDITSNGTFTNYTSNTAPITSWQVSTGSATTCAATVTGNGQWKSPNPYTCQTVGTTLANTAVNVIIEKYNVQLKNSSKSSNPCSGGSGNVTTYKCVNYEVDASSLQVNNSNVSPAISIIGTDGNLSEASKIAFGSINPNASLTINMHKQGETNPAPYTCDTSTNKPTYTCP